MLNALEMVEPVVIFLRQGDYDAVHEWLSIAAAAVAGGRRAELYFSWWALERLVKDRLDEPDLREDVAGVMERRGVPTLRQLLTHVRESKLAGIYACSGSLHALGLNPPDVEGRVDELVGWSSILKRTAGRVDRFFL
jgi:peroxiredoxin family protein